MVNSIAWSNTTIGVTWQNGQWYGKIVFQPNYKLGT